MTANQHTEQVRLNIVSTQSIRQREMRAVLCAHLTLLYLFQDDKKRAGKLKHCTTS